LEQKSKILKDSMSLTQLLWHMTFSGKRFRMIRIQTQDFSDAQPQKELF